MLRRLISLLRIFPYIWFAITIQLAFTGWKSLASSQALPRTAAILMLVFGLVDWTLLALLPRLGLSYGQIELAWLLMLCGRAAILVIFALTLGGLYQVDLAMRNNHNLAGALILWCLANLAFLAIEFYSLYVEPFDLKVTTINIPGPAFFPDRSLRLIQLADTHIERLTKRDHEILARLEAIQPDLIVLTGDYVNYEYTSEPRAIQETRTFLSQLHAPFGVYAISGSRNVDKIDTMAKLFAGLDITVLNDRAQALPINGRVLFLMGIKLVDKRVRDRVVLSRLMSQSPPGAYTLLLYHTPDLIEAAAENQVSLYLAGHTHGGQIRFPILGALITLSAYGRKYASGLHKLNGTTLYTSRGLGMEGLHLPRARFLCPPEIVIVDLGG